MNEVCCRVVFHLNAVGGTALKFKAMGGIEMVVNSMQRHAKHPEVVQAATMAMSSLAVEPMNRERLGVAGGCDAVVIGAFSLIGSVLRCL